MSHLYANRLLQSNVHHVSAQRFQTADIQNKYIICSLKKCNLYNTGKRVTVKINEQLSITVHLVLFLI